MSAIRWTRQLRTPLSPNSPILKYFTPSKPEVGAKAQFLKPTFGSNLTTASAQAFKYREAFKKYRFYKRSPATSLYKRCQSIKRRLQFDDEAEESEETNLIYKSTSQTVLMAESFKDISSNIKVPFSIPKITIDGSQIGNHPHFTCKPVHGKNDCKISPNSQAMLDILSPLENRKILKRGRIGTVISAEFKDEQFAVKVFTKNESKLSRIGIKHVIGLRHPNIIEFKSNIIEKRNLSDEFYIVYMRCYKNSISLKSALEVSMTPLLPKFLLHYSLDICRALDFLHMNSILHLDVNPKNILICLDGTLKLCDFITAINMRETNNSNTAQNQGDAQYRAPEIIRLNRPIPASDVYSFAITMWQMYHRTEPYPNSIPEEPLLHIIARDGVRPINTRSLDHNQFYTSYKNIYTACWHNRPEKRFGTKELYDKLYSLKSFI